MPSDNTHKLLRKAIHLLESMSDDHSKVSVTELAKRVDLSYASAYRIVQTFLESSWLQSDENGAYSISPNLSHLLDPATKTQRLIEQAKPHIEELARLTNLSVKFAVRRHHQALSILKAESPKTTSVSFAVGSSFHLAAGSSGAVLLSELSDPEIRTILKSAHERYWKLQSESDVFERVRQVRDEGIASDSGMFNPEVNTLSAPLRDGHGRIRAAITLLGFRSDFDASQIPNYREQLLIAAKTIHQQITQ